MHELGVVFYVIDECEKLAKENNVEHINSVTIELGTVSGVIDNYLVDCWNWAVSKHEIMTNCELKIEKIKAITHCEDCGQDIIRLCMVRLVHNVRVRILIFFREMNLI